MQKLILYCKSYHKDVDRVVNLTTSINKYNVDNIPFYVSVPKSDVTLFKSKLPEWVQLIEDETILSQSYTQNWNTQQIVKSNFWRLGISENYVCIDSDGYFIKPFYLHDFMFDDENPFTVIHEQKELFSWSVNKSHILGFDPKDSYIRDRQKVMDVFGRKGKYYDFGPVPTIWSNKVWKDLDEKYLQPNNLTFDNLIEFSPSEFSWYGESLLHFKSIPIYPCEPIFKVFHYPQQLQEFYSNNIQEKHISQNYLGIIMQSNYNPPITY
jgi:hypothetical protein